MFFIAPGPLTFDLFERGFDARMALWLGAVLVGTGIAGLRGALPGVEPKPYIIRFTEDRPNPLYRRVCYTFAWSEVDHVRGAEHRRPRRRDRDRPVVSEADLPVRVLPARRHDLAARRARTAAAREGVDQRRRARAPLLLRIGLGGLLGAAGALAAVEGRAADDRRATRSSWSCFSRSSRSSATSRGSAVCRARGRSSPASSPSRIRLLRRVQLSLSLSMSRRARARHCTSVTTGQPDLVARVRRLVTARTRPLVLLV